MPLIALLLFFTALGGAELVVVEETISVDGKEAVVYAIKGELELVKGGRFDVNLKNTLSVPTSVHWHGLILPNNQDGVGFITQFPIYPGETYKYQFPLVQSGTYWMHSHFGLQEQRLLSAPLVIRDPDDAKMTEVVIFLTDFSWQTPSEIYRGLRCPVTMKMGQDIYDVEYDAFLANGRTLENPEVIEVMNRVRLRIINGSSATNFFIHLGELVGEAIAVDGNNIYPVRGSEFELADAQRIDIIVTIPEGGGAFPILAQAEGTDKQTGVILATKGAAVPKVDKPEIAGRLTNRLEREFKPLKPLIDKKVDKRLVVELGGDMATYTWTINGQAWPESTPLVVEKGQRVEILFKNNTAMSHPMHLHGHVFQVKGIDGESFDGPMRDTCLVTSRSTMRIEFDADNPGVWPLHCHILYHLEAGMFTVLRYAGFQQSSALFEASQNKIMR